jgi:hypothetical protein
VSATRTVVRPELSVTAPYRPFPPDGGPVSVAPAGAHHVLVSDEHAIAVRQAFRTYGQGGQFEMTRTRPMSLDVRVPGEFSGTRVVHERWRGNECLGLAPWTGPWAFHWCWTMLWADDGRWVTTEAEPYYTVDATDTKGRFVP